MTRTSVLVLAFGTVAGLALVRLYGGWLQEELERLAEIEMLEAIPVLDENEA